MVHGGDFFNKKLPLMSRLRPAISSWQSGGSFFSDEFIQACMGLVAAAVNSSANNSSRNEVREAVCCSASSRAGSAGNSVSGIALLDVSLRGILIVSWEAKKSSFGDTFSE